MTKQTKHEYAKDEWEIHGAMLELVTLQGTLVLVEKKLRAKDYETAQEYLDIALVRTETALLALEKLLNEHEQPTNR